MKELIRRVYKSLDTVQISNRDFCEKKGVLEQTVSSLFEHVLFSLQWQDKILFTLFTTAHLSPLRRHCDIVYLRELYSE